jgi:uncharacterized repeat protein (TIGR01451 family)
MLKKITGLFVVCSLIALPSMADIAGTPAGTSIISSGISMNYQGGGGPVITGNETPAVSITVEHIAGIHQTILPLDLNAAAGGTATYIFRYENKGNYSDALMLARGDVIKSGNAGGAWTVGEWTPVDPNLPDNGDVATQFNVTVALNARNGSSGSVTVNARSASAVNNGWPTGTYVGFNGNNYGGSLEENDSVVTTVVGPLIDIQNRTVTVNQPSGYQGSGTDPVPGAQLIYTVTVKNNGAGNASGLKIVEHIVGPVDYSLGSMTDNRGGTKEYLIGVSRHTDGGSGITQNVSSLEWTFDLNAGDTAILTYGVVIR